MVNIPGLYISCWRLERGHRRRRQTTARIPELPTDRHFLDLSEKCLNVVHFGLGPFFKKKCLNCFQNKPKTIRRLFLLLRY